MTIKLLRGCAYALSVLASGLLIVFAETRHDLFQSYLTSYLFWTWLSLGCLGLSLLHGLTGGRWGRVSALPFKAAAGAIPGLAVLFVPVVLGKMSPQDSTDLVATNATAGKAIYLSLPFFIVRATAYFGIWTMLRRVKSAWAAPALVIFVLSVSFAAIDWTMSLNPSWYSSIYGCIAITSQAASALCLTIFTVAILNANRVIPDRDAKLVLPDLGNFLLAFVMLWAYLTFSQYMLIWYGNIAEEATYYLRRSTLYWRGIAAAMVCFFFAVPFCFLLSRRIKESRWALSAVAGLVLTGLFLEAAWSTRPDYLQQPHLAWKDVLAFLAVGGLWLGLFLGRLEPAIRFASAGREVADEFPEGT